MAQVGEMTVTLNMNAATEALLAIREAADAALAQLKVVDAVALHRAVLVLSTNGHIYGKQHCASCAGMTAALGQAFGCDLFREHWAKGSAP